MPQSSGVGTSARAVVEQLAHLLSRFNIPAKENDAAGFDLLDQLARFGIDFGARAVR